MNLAEMKIGDRYEGRLVLIKADIRKTKGRPPKSYLSVTFSDGKAELSGNIWDYPESQGIPERAVYDVVAQVGEYAGKKQLNNIAYMLSSDQNMMDFSLTYDCDATALSMELCNVADAISNPTLRAIVNETLSACWEQFIDASSAAGVHHVGIYGNMAHTLEVYELAKSMADVMKARGYDVDRDLCMAGALLHDLGKVDTYLVEGPSVEITRAGMLLDHIAIGVKRLVEYSETARSAPETCILLEHLILSHHGVKEFGSPVTPKFMEAYIVNKADGLSATLNTLRGYNDKAAAEQRPGGTTERIFTLSNYAHITQATVQEMLKA